MDELDSPVEISGDGGRVHQADHLRVTVADGFGPERPWHPLTPEESHGTRGKARKLHLVTAGAKIGTGHGVLQGGHLNLDSQVGQVGGNDQSGVGPPTALAPGLKSHAEAVPEGSLIQQFARRRQIPLSFVGKVEQTLRRSRVLESPGRRRNSAEGLLIDLIPVDGQRDRLPDLRVPQRVTVGQSTVEGNVVLAVVRGRVGIDLCRQRSPCRHRQVVHVVDGPGGQLQHPGSGVGHGHQLDPLDGHWPSDIVGIGFDHPLRSPRNPFPQHVGTGADRMAEVFGILFDPGTRMDAHGHVGQSQRKIQVRFLQVEYDRLGIRRLDLPDRLQQDREVRPRMIAVPGVGEDDVPAGDRGAVRIDQSLLETHGGRQPVTGDLHRFGQLRLHGPVVIQPEELSGDQVQGDDARLMGGTQNVQVGEL